MKFIPIFVALAIALPATFAGAQTSEPTIRLLPPTDMITPAECFGSPTAAQPSPPRMQQPVVSLATVPPASPELHAGVAPVQHTSGTFTIASEGVTSPMIPATALSTAQPEIFPPGQSSTVPETIPPGSPAPAAPRMFGVSDLEGIALANNPTLSQAAARVKAARANYVQVGLYPNPTVGYQGVEIGNEGRAGQQGVYLGQEFVLGKKLQLNRNAAAQAVRQAEQEFEAQRWRVVNDVRTGFYDTLVAQRKMEIIAQLQRIAEQGLDTANKLYKPPAQEVTEVDVLQAEIELGNAKVMAANATNAYLSAWRRLAATLGVPNMQPVGLTGDLEAGICELTWEQSLHQVMASSPELMAARAGVEQAKWALSRARAEPIPNIDTQLTLQHDNATTNDIVGVQAVLPVPLFNRNQGGIGRAQAELTVASREVQRIELSLQQRLAVAFERYANAKRQVDIYAKDILPKSKRAFDLVASGYRETEFNYLMVLNAQRTYFHTNLAYLDALRELRETSISIQGLLLSDSLGVGPTPTVSTPNYPTWDASPVIPGMGR